GPEDGAQLPGRRQEAQGDGERVRYEDDRLLADGAQVAREAERRAEGVRVRPSVAGHEEARTLADEVERALEAHWSPPPPEGSSPRSRRREAKTSSMRAPWSTEPSQKKRKVGTERSDSRCDSSRRR